MAISESNQTQLAFKKLFGKSHSTSDLQLGGEPFESWVTAFAHTTFADDIDADPAQAVIDGTAVQKINAEFVAIAESNGHAWKLIEPAGSPTDPNDELINCISPQVDYRYEIVVRDTAGDVIPVLDPRDWVFDYARGIFFEQDIVGLSPHRADIYVYDGRLIKDVSLSGADANLDYLTFSDESAGLPNSRNLIAGTGITFDDTVANQRTISAPSAGGAPATSTYLTKVDETGDLANSEIGVALDNAQTITGIKTFDADVRIQADSDLDFTSVASNTVGIKANNNEAWMLKAPLTGSPTSWMEYWQGSASVDPGVAPAGAAADISLAVDAKGDGDLLLDSWKWPHDDASASDDHVLTVTSAAGKQLGFSAVPTPTGTADRIAHFDGSGNLTSGNISETHPDSETTDLEIEYTGVNQQILNITLNSSNASNNNLPQVKFTGFFGPGIEAVDTLFVGRGIFEGNMAFQNVSGNAKIQHLDGDGITLECLGGVVADRHVLNNTGLFKMTEETADPGNEGTLWQFYFKSDGMYIKEPGGTFDVIGPLAPDPGTVSWKTINTPSGDPQVVAITPDDEITLIATGGGITITGDDTAKSITFNVAPGGPGSGFTQITDGSDVLDAGDNPLIIFSEPSGQTGEVYTKVDNSSGEMIVGLGDPDNPPNRGSIIFFHPNNATTLLEPATDGSDDDKYVQFDGSNMVLTAVTPGSGISQVEDDLAPVLGGSLNTTSGDGTARSIYSDALKDIKIIPGTGADTIVGRLSLRSAASTPSQIHWQTPVDVDGPGGVVWKSPDAPWAPGTSNDPWVFSWPAVPPSQTNMCLVTDATSGSGWTWFKPASNTGIFSNKNSVVGGHGAGSSTQPAAITNTVNKTTDEPSAVANMDSGFLVDDPNASIYFANQDRVLLWVDQERGGVLPDTFVRVTANLKSSIDGASIIGDGATSDENLRIGGKGTGTVFMVSDLDMDTNDFLFAPGGGFTGKRRGGNNSAFEILQIADDTDTLRFTATASDVTIANVNGDIRFTSVGDINVLASTDLLLQSQIWPASDGTALQILKTDGSANLSWSGPVEVQTTEPAVPFTGQLWYDTDESGTTFYSQMPLRTETSNYTMTNTDVVVLGSGTITLTLPTAVGISGRSYQVKNISTGVVTLDGDGSETIDGQTTQALSQDEALTVISDGTEWWII